jgi:pepF/M3 family oligoendopeptidase
VAWYDTGMAIPRWNLETIYPAFSSVVYRNDIDLLKDRINTLLTLLDIPLTDVDAVVKLLRAWEEAGDIAENLRAYADAVYTADTRDSSALAEINALERAALPLGKATVLLRKRLAEQKDVFLNTLGTEPLAPYRFFIAEALEKAAFQMPPDMEDLANDLTRSGSSAWERLHEAISSTVGADMDGTMKTVIQLRGMAMDADRSLREKAFKAELAAWTSVETALAAALNGVKGTAITLDARRGWQSPLQKSAFQSRMSEQTLATLIKALESSLPLFRRYLKAKARLLGLDRCAFYDLFAPLGKGRQWTFEEASQFIIRQFSAFDPAMGDFAGDAFTKQWIDAEMREGKIGGAYCTDFPLSGVSRILCNFDGSFDGVNTLAHELGHAWHHELIKNYSRARAEYPMTLAETASVFAETIVFEGAYAEAKTGAERLFLIEGNLKDCCQVIVDILSRFYFEKALFERREQAELSPAELCSLMVDAQKRTYGDGLDAGFLHPYMWAVKSHYYSANLGFYNYPYAFGQLFSLGLYAKASQVKNFAGQYRELLTLTGSASVEEVALSAGFDVKQETFWQDALGIIAKRVEELEQGIMDKK